MYQRGALNASSIVALAESVRVELDKLALHAAQPADYLALKTIFSEPGRVLEGMLVKADGTTWNPGSGAGVYVRDGGAWIKL